VGTPALLWGQTALARHGDRGFPDDCFTYELAREMLEPVLWKGDDFGDTDWRAAVVEMQAIAPSRSRYGASGQAIEVLARPFHGKLQTVVVIDNCRFILLILNRIYA
jgi:hypothetical protein